MELFTFRSFFSKQVKINVIVARSRSHIHTIVYYLKTLKKISLGGGGVHAMAPVVCRWSPRTGIGPRPVDVSLMVGKVAQGQVLSEFSPVVIIPPMFRTHFFTYDRLCKISALDSVVK